MKWISEIRVGNNTSKFHVEERRTLSKHSSTSSIRVSLRSSLSSLNNAYPTVKFFTPRGAYLAPISAWTSILFIFGVIMFIVFERERSSDITPIHVSVGIEENYSRNTLSDCGSWKLRIQQIAVQAKTIRLKILQIFEENRRNSNRIGTYRSSSGEEGILGMDVYWPPKRTSLCGQASGGGCRGVTLITYMTRTIYRAEPISVKRNTYSKKHIDTFPNGLVHLSSETLKPRGENRFTLAIRIKIDTVRR